MIILYIIIALLIGGAASGFTVFNMAHVAAMSIDKNFADKFYHKMRQYKDRHVAKADMLKYKTALEDQISRLSR